jgi:hypothetical protein
MNATDLLAQIDITNAPTVRPCDSGMGVLSMVVKATTDHSLKRIAGYKATMAQAEKLADIAVNVIIEKTGESYDDVMADLLDTETRFYPRCTAATRRIMVAMGLVESAFVVVQNRVHMNQPGADMAERVLRAGLAA